MQIIVDIDDRIARELTLEAKRDGHNKTAAVARKAISFYVNHTSQRNAFKRDVSLSPAVFDALKKECPKKAELNHYFVDTIVRLGIAEHKRIRKTSK